MTLLAALVVATMFASGTFLLLQRDLFRMVVGIIMISNAATLFIIASGLTRGKAPIYPLGGAPVSDPLVQAMALTALVIGFGVAALLLAMVYRLFVSHGSVDAETVARTARRRASLLDHAGDPVEEEIPPEEPEPQEQPERAL